MAISLQKGQRISLTKDNPELSTIVVGLGWDPNQSKLKGTGGLFKTPSFDCDASVLMLNENKKLDSKNDVIYFGNLKSACRSIIHSGDNLTGKGEGDDEQIHVILKKVPNHIQRLLFVVNIYACKRRKQHFGMISNAFIRVVDEAKQEELIRYNLTDDYEGKTALIAGELYRHNDGWKFAAIGEGTTDVSLPEINARYQ